MRRIRGGRGSSASLRLMLDEMARHPVVTAEQEAELWRRYRIEGDARAGEQLILANLRFVVMVANRYRLCGVPMSDLIQEGNVGLVKAVQRFRPELGCRLTSYAVWWIRSQIQSCILGSYSMVKLGTSRAQRKVFFSLARARRELGASPSGEGTPEAPEMRALAGRLGVKVDELDELLRRIGGRDVSIDFGELGATLAAEGSGETPMERDGGESPGQGERLASLRAALERMCPRDRAILEARYLCNPPVKLKCLAAQLGVTTARVFQLEVRALQRLRVELGAASRQSRAPVPSRTPVSSRTPAPFRTPVGPAVRAPLPVAPAPGRARRARASPPAAGEGAPEEANEPMKLPFGEAELGL